MNNTPKKTTEIEDCSGCTDSRSEGTHAMHTKQHPCKEGGDPDCGYCFPQKTTEEWRDEFEAEVIKRIRATYPESVWLPVPEELRAKDAVMAQALRDMAPAIAGVVGEILEDFISEKLETKDRELSLERKRVAEEIVGMAWVSEVCNCPGPKMWVMNRCMVCKKVGIDQRTANQALSSLIAKVKEKYLS